MKNKKIIFGKVLCYILAFIVAGLSLFPLIWMAISGFKPEIEVLKVPLRFFPTKWVTESYQRLFKDNTYPFLSSIVSTAYVAIIATVMAIAVNSMAAYAFARLEFKFKRSLWIIIIATMYIPGITILITSFILVTTLNILNTYTVLIIPGVAGAYAIFFFRQFFLNLPRAMEESALIDGASRFKIFISIFLPLSTSPLVIIGIGTFLGYWNSFIWPTMTITDVHLLQVMQVIRSYRGMYTSKFGTIMAASTLAAIPPILIFLIFQKYIVKGIVLSGIK